MMRYHGVFQAMFDALTSQGIQVDDRAIKKREPDEVIEKARGYRATIAGGEPYTEAVLSALSENLRVISRFGIGYEKIDVEAATKLGIAVTNTPGKNAPAVAELALSLLLCVTRGVVLQERSMRSGGWSAGYVGRGLEGKTVGIVGFGHIGQKLAQYLQGFRCRILAYDLYPNKEAAKLLGAQFCSLDEIARESDFVSIHTPLTAESRGLIDGTFLSKMRREAYLINTSRGPVVNERDLIEALQEGKIAGAGLDVFEIEPVEKDNALLTMDNVVLSPHVGSSTHESIDEVGLCVAENIAAVLDGQVAPNAVNPDYVKYMHA